MCKYFSFHETSCRTQDVSYFAVKSTLQFMCSQSCLSQIAPVASPLKIILAVSKEKMCAFGRRKQDLCAYITRRREVQTLNCRNKEREHSFDWSGGGGTNNDNTQKASVNTQLCGVGGWECMQLQQTCVLMCYFFPDVRVEPCGRAVAPLHTCHRRILYKLQTKTPTERANTDLKLEAIGTYF